MVNKVLCLNKLASKHFNSGKQNAKVTGSTLPYRVERVNMQQLVALLCHNCIFVQDIFRAKKGTLADYVIAPLSLIVTVRLMKTCIAKKMSGYDKNLY